MTALNLPKSLRGLTAARLKLLAMTLMFIDHIGGYLLPFESSFYPLCRGVGRLAFPIFCFLIAEGARHTRSMPKYMARLAAFAFISMPPHNLVHGAEWYAFSCGNVFFTLLLGLTGIFSIQHLAPALFRQCGKSDLARSRPACTLLALPFCTALYFAAYWLETDYGGYGVATILIFWLLHEKPAAAWGIFALLTFVCYDFVFVRQSYVGLSENLPCNPYSILRNRLWEGSFTLQYQSVRQMLAPLALFPCTAYNGEKGGLKATWSKYLFYAFYPAHLFLLWIVQLLTK